MPGKIRYNKAIDLLIQDKPVFSSGLVWNGNLEDLAFVTDSDYDMVIIEMEHQGFNLNDLRVSLQFLLSRKKVAEQGNLQADPVPMVRIPPNTSEHNQWVMKQDLDTGVYGLVLPHLNTVEDSQAAVAAARYPQSARGLPTSSPRESVAGGPVSRPATGALTLRTTTTQRIWSPPAPRRKHSADGHCGRAPRG